MRPCILTRFGGAIATERRRDWLVRPFLQEGHSTALSMAGLATQSSRTWEKHLGFFVLIIIAVVVAQTWHDWRKSSKDLVLPEWAKGLALGGVLAISTAGLASFASTWMQDPTNQLGGILESHQFWPEAGLVAISAAVILLMARERRLPWMLLLAGMLVAAFCVGAVFAS